VPAILERPRLRLLEVIDTGVIDAYIPGCVSERRPWVTVVETPAYLARAERILDEVQRQAVVDLLTANPEIGDVIQGTGGARKVRFAVDGRGKSGGARVIYFFHNEGMPVFLLAVYTKNQKANLSAADKNAMQKLCKAIVATYAKRGG
jgi:hypothetical protein